MSTAAEVDSQIRMLEEMLQDVPEDRRDAVLANKAKIMLVAGPGFEGYLSCHMALLALAKLMNKETK